MGQLHLATTEAPSGEMIRDLARATGLDLRFRLTQLEKLRKLLEMVSQT